MMSRTGKLVILVVWINLTLGVLCVYATFTPATASVNQRNVQSIVA
jgi:hypothetical protein